MASLLSVLVLSLAIVAAFPVGSDSNKQIADVRKATTQYHDIENALDDGYVQASECVEAPGIGAMGYHYVNFGLVNDGVIDPLHPEVLLYIDSGNGLRLVGVEYLLPVEPHLHRVLPSWISN